VASRTYGQYCPIAHALDEIGDRWVLLILRDLSMGPQRFTDLRESLVGLAPNLLTERLRDLEDAGLVARSELPAPAARTVYGLTEDGRSVFPVLNALARFGARRLPAPREKTVVRPRAALVGAITAFHEPGAVSEPNDEYRIVLDGTAFDVSAANARVRPALDETVPVATFTTTPRTLLAIRRGEITLSQSIAAGDVETTGTKKAIRSFCRAFAVRY
jgi:DNA-binding HxlR family transcriptional regulator